MKNNTLVIIGLVVFGVLALGLTALLFVMPRNRQAQNVAPPEAKPVAKMFVAAREIAPRTRLTPEMIEEREAEGDLPDGAFTNREELVGKLVAQRLQPGQAVTQASLTDEIARVLPANFSIPPNMRAVAVHVNSAQTVAGLVDVGDRVDVLVTHEISSKDLIGTGNLQTVAGRTIAQNLEVLAVDRSIQAAEAPPTPTPPPAAAANGENPPPPPPPPTPDQEQAQAGSDTRVVLAATPTIAERLIAANRSGQVNLTIRNPESNDFQPPSQALEYPIRLINTVDPAAREAARKERLEQRQRAEQKAEARRQERRADISSERERRQALAVLQREQRHQLEMARLEAARRVPPMPLQGVRQTPRNTGYRPPAPPVQPQIIQPPPPKEVLVIRGTEKTRVEVPTR